VTSLYETFQYASAFNQALCWDTTGIFSFSMFYQSSGSANPNAAKCACTAGQFYDGTTCQFCPAGQDSNGKTESCYILPIPAPTSTPAPTAVPTQAPTQIPSLSALPTLAPTLVPSLKPSSLPRPAPSTLPSPEPTHIPSLSAPPTLAPSTFWCTNFTVEMFATFGDGWNGDVLYLGDYTFTFSTGFYSSASVCLPPGTYAPYVCGGFFNSEVSWSVGGLSGGADDTCTGTAGSFSVNRPTPGPSQLPSTLLMPTPAPTQVQTLNSTLIHTISLLPSPLPIPRPTLRPTTRSLLLTSLV
jgi:hypothetical protein